MIVVGADSILISSLSSKQVTFVTHQCSVFSFCFVLVLLLLVWFCLLCTTLF